MKQGSAAFLLIAAVLEAGLVASLVTSLATGQFGLTVEILLFVGLLIWAILAFCGRELWTSRNEPLDPLFSERVAERHARYGIYALPVASKNGEKKAVMYMFTGPLPLLVAVLASATVLGAAFVFSLVENMALAGAISGSASFAALALYCSRGCSRGQPALHQDLRRRLERQISRR
jgi:hypothetical protein